LVDISPRRRARKGAVAVVYRFLDAAQPAPVTNRSQDSYASRAPSSAAALNSNVVSVHHRPATSPAGPAPWDSSDGALLHPRGRVVTASDGPAAAQLETAHDKLWPHAHHVLRTRSPRLRSAHLPCAAWSAACCVFFFCPSADASRNAERRGSRSPTGRVPSAPGRRRRACASSAHSSSPLVWSARSPTSARTLRRQQVIRTLVAEMVGRPGPWRRIRGATRPDHRRRRRAAAIRCHGSRALRCNRFSAESIVAVRARRAARLQHLGRVYLASLAGPAATGRRPPHGQPLAAPTCAPDGNAGRARAVLSGFGIARRHSAGLFISHERSPNPNRGTPHPDRAAALRARPGRPALRPPQEI